jgi:chorismate dehydratase
MHADDTMIPGSLRLGTPVDFYTAPLVVPLGSADVFVRHPDTPARLGLSLREGKLDAAFLSPLDYARESSLYEIIPGAGAASSVSTGTVSLVFREENLHTVTTIAIDPAFTSEIFLAKIVLAEEFELKPKFVPVNGSVGDMLAQTDAVLLVGDASLRAVDVHPNRIDLVETWTEMTGLPYVHGVWVARIGKCSPAHANALQDAVRNGMASLERIAGDAPATLFPHQNRGLLYDYLGAFSYELTDEDVDGFEEFIRFAYYHGVLPDVGDINFYSPETPDRPNDDDIASR